MPSRWYRSLYWRIAIGFVLCLAAMLVVQATLFVWLVWRSESPMPGRPPANFGQTVALELAEALEREPQLDVQRHVDDEYEDEVFPFFVVLTSGTTVTHGGPFPEAMVAPIRDRLQRGLFERPVRGGRFARERDPADRNPETRTPAARNPAAAFRPQRPAPIIVNGDLLGVVVVPPRAPFTLIASRYLPTLAAVAGGVLVVGALLAAVVIFGPARRRLRDVENAARRLGAGDITARAPVYGGDEVAAVAAAFNTMADDLTARAAALSEADRTRRQLLADVSHELTTPVTAMRGYLETLAMPEFELDQSTRVRYLSIISDEMHRLERIIGDLLELARLEGGGGALVMENVPIADLFARVVARHERASGDAGIILRSAVEPGVEGVRGDRGRLEQALQNLAANAIRYAPAGTTVELRARNAGDSVVITVADEGPGIAPEHVPHVFDRFYKAEASRAPQSGEGAKTGSGLGLSIVKAIVERHGARITVSSQPGRTVFEISGLQAGPKS
jgi:two-component system sensor histidine kinase BaeS